MCNVLLQATHTHDLAKSSFEVKVGDRGWSHRACGRSAALRVDAWSYEGLFHGPQLRVAEHGFERVDLGVLPEVLSHEVLKIGQT